MCIDPSGGGGASSWKRFTISCYIFVSPAGRSIFFGQLYLVLWQRESHREMAPHICSRVSLKCLLKSSLWGSGCGLQSSLMYLRTLEAGSSDIQYVSVQPKSLNILPVVTEQAFWWAYVCVFVCKKMTRWHFLVSCRISVIVTCRFLSVSPAQSSSKTPVTATESSRAHSPSVKIGENGWDGSLVRKHSWIPVTKRSPLSPRGPVFSQESEAMSRWRRNFSLLFFESNSLIYSRNKQMRLITFVTPRLYITSQICGIRTEL